jgi:hypothetical protein
VAPAAATARAIAPHLIIVIASSIPAGMLAGLLGFEDRDANSPGLDLQAGDAIV